MVYGKSGRVGGDCRFTHCIPGKKLTQLAVGSPPKGSLNPAM